MGNDDNEDDFLSFFQKTDKNKQIYAKCIESAKNFLHTLTCTENREREKDKQSERVCVCECERE